MANPIKIKTVVTDIINHDAGVYTICFKSEKKIPRFKPGQFLHLALDEYNPQGGFWPESRVFSIASSYNPENLAIVYSVKGNFTSRMSKELAVGKSVWLKLPYGNFIIEANTHTDQDIVLVAGGTGISPFISYLETTPDGSNKRKVHLIYGVRKKEHLLFEKIISACVKNTDIFTMDLFIEDFMDSRFYGAMIKPLPGIISFEHIINAGKRLHDPLYFLSGPPLMIKSIKESLIQNGIQGDTIKMDEWE